MIENPDIQIISKEYLKSELILDITIPRCLLVTEIYFKNELKY